MNDEVSLSSTTEDLRQQEVVQILKETIAENGYTYMVSGDENTDIPRLVYTVGAHCVGLPEVVVSGNLHPTLAYQLIENLYEHWGHEGKVSEGLIDDLAASSDGEDWPVMVKRIALNPSVVQQVAMLGQIYPEYKGEIYQLIWSDPDGHFPNDPRYSTHTGMRQMLFD